MEDESKNLKSIQFSGQKTDYLMWQAKFLSYANYKGFKEVILGNKKLSVAKTGETLSDADITLNNEFKKKNDMAYSFLHLCVKDPVSFGAIYNAMTDELPDGDAHQAWENLMTIFKPVSSAQKHELEQAFNQSSLLKEQKNPDEWFAELEKIRLQLKLDFKTTIDDDQMISQIIYNLHPPQYKTTIALIKRDLNKGAEVTLQDVEEDIRQIYGAIQNPLQKKGESALIGKAGFQKSFKGLCRICGGRHKAADCWELEKNKAKRSSKFKPTLYKKGDTPKGETANIGAPYQGPPCSYCKKTNHPLERCFKKRDDDLAKAKGLNKNENKEPFTNKREGMMIAVTKQEVEMLMSTTTGPSRLTQNTFIADSGATCHMRNSTSGMYDLEDDIQEITVGNSDVMLSKYRGKFRGTIIQQDGGYMDIVLNDVLFVPELWLNLISITKALTHPHISLQSDGELITIIFNQEQENGQKDKLVFDKVYPAGSGQLLGVEIQPCDAYANMVMLTEALTIYEDLHEKLGHPNDKVVTKTASHHGIKTRDKKEKCRFCIMGKHKRLPIPRNVSNLTSARGERINIDVSSVAVTSYGGAKYWLLIQDDYTDYIWSYFIKEKSQVADTFMTWLNIIQKETKITIQKVRCDNSGENRKLQQLIKLDHNWNVKF